MEKCNCEACNQFDTLVSILTALGATVIPVDVQDAADNCRSDKAQPEAKQPQQDQSDLAAQLAAAKEELDEMRNFNNKLVSDARRFRNEAETKAQAVISLTSTCREHAEREAQRKLEVSDDKRRNMVRDVVRVLNMFA